MTYLHPSNPEIQRPVSNLFILLTVLVALFLNGLPLEGIWLMMRPDFVAVVLLYWCTHNPLRLGVGLSWAVGILADVADASLFGQHALAYTLLAFGGVVLHRRLQMFDLRQQTTQVFIILVLTYAVYALVHWQVNGYVVWPYFLGCLTSTLLWAPLSIMFQAMRQLRVDREHP
ncbi:rod shape-determining protein MreD [Ferrigenium kumadai]|uniref:Rod shape-determining protein MreD n=1 Tax=Ferrigenium kumadai TaxID=1682490 RepID=A0AAN1VYQ0_9PROT|nr:rod shape-determining protein MreD [Ferrigenium kumadai]BBI98449.1 rod shape-determining protein MreD [Ferrigenium kumadai]